MTLLAGSLAWASLVAPPPAAASYSVVATAGVSAGICTDVDNSGVLTAPSASASAACPSGSAQAFADISTASMGVYAFADSTPQVLTITSAEAEFFDQVHFHVPPALDGQPFSLGVAFALDGAISADATPTVTALLTSRCILTDLSSQQQYDGLFVDTSPVSGLRTIPGTLSITPPDYTMYVSMHMLAPGLTEGTVDFSTSAELQLDVPPGVTYDSDSGVFHAPEPGTDAIGTAAAAALAAVGARALARQRRRSRSMLRSSDLVARGASAS